jgi:succinate-semialdehyde dehydrogenase
MCQENVIQQLLQRARAAQKIFEGYNQQQVDAVVKSIGKIIFDNAEDLAKDAVQESGLGDVESKVRKQRNVAISHWTYLKDKKSVGAIEEDPILQVTTYAKPIGVVACITPATNPTSTICGNGMYALKCRNAIIISPHPRTKKVTIKCADLVRGELKKLGAPEDLVLVIEEPSIERTQELMSKADVIIATGGPGMVKSAYSSGKPSFGVGPGNVQSIIDCGCQEKYDEYARGTIRCRTTDNGIQCTAEQCIILPESEKEAILNTFVENGAYLVEDRDVDTIRKALFTKMGDEYKINVEYVGKSAMELAKMLGLNVPENTQVLIVKAIGTADVDPLCREKLCPVMAYLTFEKFEDGVGFALQNLQVEGAGHSACLFTNDEKHIDYTANLLPVSRLMVNTAATVAGGNSFAIGYNPTMSLGCGTWGNNSISENLYYRHLMNTTKVATIIENAPSLTIEEIWA